MADAGPYPTRYRIDDLMLEPGTRRVLRDDDPVELPKLSFDLLLALARAAPNVVEVDKLIETVWRDVVVSDETLTQRVKMLRDALAVGGDKQHYVETVRGVSYRLKPSVVEVDDSPATSRVTNRTTSSAGNRMVGALLHNRAHSDVGAHVG